MTENDRSICYVWNSLHSATNPLIGVEKAAQYDVRTTRLEQPAFCNESIDYSGKAAQHDVRATQASATSGTACMHSARNQLITVEKSCSVISESHMYEEFKLK